MRGMDIKKIRKYIYQNAYWVKAVYLSIVIGYVFPSLLVETLTISKFLAGVILVMATACFIFYFNLWKNFRKYYNGNGGYIVWYVIVWGLFSLFSAGRYAIEFFPEEFSLETEQIIHALWLLTALAYFLLDYVVFQSWKGVDYWVRELITDAKAYSSSIQMKDDQAAIKITQRIFYELNAIKYKDSKLSALVPLLEHENDGIRFWAARFLLACGDNEKRELEVFSGLAKKEGRIGEAAQKIFELWGEEKARKVQIDSLLENTPIIKPKEIAAVGRTALLTAFAFILFVLVPLMGVLFYGERFGQTTWFILGGYYLVGIYLFRRTFNS